LPFVPLTVKVPSSSLIMHTSSCVYLETSISIFPDSAILPTVASHVEILVWPILSRLFIVQKEVASYFW
jgi:hypothetical protein